MKLNFHKRNSNEKNLNPIFKQNDEAQKSARVEDPPKFIITVWPEHLTAE